MARNSQPQCESVDLTEDEDEDSRDTVVESEINPHYGFERSEQSFGNVPLPSLIPIPRVNSPVKVLNKNVPTLTKIKPKDEPTALGIHNQFVASGTIVAANPEGTTSTRVPTKGKLVLIKKNNKLYKIVIPHNVMPTTCDTGGPVVINIPEVGPLVIKIDPQVKKEPTAKLTSPLEPFSLNFDEILQKTSTEAVNQHRISTRACSSPEKTLLSPKKPFYCWKTPAGRIRSKFSSNPGFSKRDCASSKKCLNMLNMCINKKQWQLQNRIKYFHKHNKSKNKAPLNSINFDDLLLTKKVIILNDDKEEKTDENSIGNTRKKKSLMSKKDRSRKRNKSLPQRSASENKTPVPMNEGRYKHLIKPCYVHMVRSTEIEKMQRCNEKRILLSKKKLLSNKEYVNNITKSCSPEVLESRTDKFESLVIKSKSKFRDAIAFIKPLLVVNVYNFSLIKFETEYSKANIVFSVNENGQFPKEILESSTFFEAVTKGYVKLVESNILCTYLKEELGMFNPIASI